MDGGSPRNWCQGFYSLNGYPPIRSREVSKLQDSGLDFLFNHSEIWQAPRQHCCRDACQISKWYDYHNIRFHSLKSSQDLTVRCPSAKWIENLISTWRPSLNSQCLGIPIINKDGSKTCVDEDSIWPSLGTAINPTLLTYLCWWLTSSQCMLSLNERCLCFMKNGSFSWYLVCARKT